MEVPPAINIRHRARSTIIRKNEYKVIHVYRHPSHGAEVPEEPKAHYGDVNIGFVQMMDDEGQVFSNVFCKAHNDRADGRCSDEECTSLDVDHQGDWIPELWTVWLGNQDLIDMIQLVQRNGLLMIE